MREFGEQVLYLKPGSAGKEKFDARWERGIFLGMKEDSGEWYIGTDSGVLKVHRTKAIEDETNRWSGEALDSIKGVPWEPIPGRPDIEVTTKTTTLGDFIPRFQEPSDPEPQVTRMRLSRADVRKYGATVKCPGCDSALRGAAAQNHTEKCRKRIEECIDKDAQKQIRQRDGAVNAQIRRGHG